MKQKKNVTAKKTSRPERANNAPGWELDLAEPGIDTLEEKTMDAAKPELSDAFVAPPRSAKKRIMARVGDDRVTYYVPPPED